MKQESLLVRGGSPRLEPWGDVTRRVVLSPADLERANINLVGGDPYSGSCQIDQFFLWRPLVGYPSHRTPIANLYHIGASTHPGPGLGAASGTIVARMLLREAWPQRVIQMLPRKRAASRPAQPSHDM